MPTVAKVSELLGLPHFFSYETALICHMKHKMRMTLGGDFKGNVKYRVIESVEEARDIDFYPIMMKPVDSQGQRGVCKVESYEDIEKNFENSLSFSKCKKVILEEYLEGKEVSVNVYVVHDELKFCVVSDRISYSQFPGGIIKKHVLPTGVSKEVVHKIEDLVSRTLKQVGIHEGTAYFQMKIVDDEPYVIEVTPRLDGCHMWRMLDLSYGVNLLELCFTQLLGNQMQKIKPKTLEKKMELEFMCQPPKTVLTSHKKLEGLYSQWYYDVGDTVKTLNGYMEKCGYTIRSY